MHRMVEPKKWYSCYYYGSFRDYGKLLFYYIITI